MHSIKKELSIIVPSHNEGKSIIKNIRMINRSAVKLGIPFEIIVVDDGSIDFTFQLIEDEKIRNPNLKFIRIQQNCGKGLAVRRGILQSEGVIVCFMDADLAIQPKYLPIFISTIKDGHDIAIASRFIKDSTYLYPVPFTRKILSHSCRLARLAIVGMPQVKDTQCGFKVMGGKLAREICTISKIDGFCFDVELLYIANKKKCRIIELPVAVDNSYSSHVDVIRDSINVLSDLFRIRVNSFLKRYGRNL